jgi:hypothetical protein
VAGRFGSFLAKGTGLVPILSIYKGIGNIETRALSPEREHSNNVCASGSRPPFARKQRKSGRRRSNYLVLHEVFEKASALFQKNSRPDREPDLVPDKSVFSPANIGGSIVGGLAAAAVFAVLSKGGLAALLLAHFAPLPIMIIALGLGIVHGATAALVAAIAVTLGLHPVFGMAHGLFVALPAWLACYAVVGAPRKGRDLLPSRGPAFAVLALAVSIASAVILFLAINRFSQGKIDEPLGFLQGILYQSLKELHNQKKLGEEVSEAEITYFVGVLFPATLATYWVLIHALNLWAAGRLTKLSGMLTLAWPDIAKDFELPRATGVVFAVSAGLAGFSGFTGAAAMTLAATLGLTLAFQGLAVTHYWLRGSKSSAFVLSVLYFILGFLGAPIVLFTVLGMIDLLARFRERKSTPDQV